MRIGDLLYFAPQIRFDQLDLDGPALPLQYRQRLLGLYIEPAEGCAGRGQAFAAGTLLVSCIDALARLRFGGGVGERFRRFAREELPSFVNPNLAGRFYDEFRNGLVHEARLKEGAQFSLDTTGTVVDLQGLLLINPTCLSFELRAAIDVYVALLERDAVARAKLAEALRRDHAKDLLAAKT